MVRDRSRKLSEEGAALSEKFWRISLYVTDDTIAQIYVTKSLVKYREMVENLVTFSSAIYNEVTN